MAFYGGFFPVTESEIWPAVLKIVLKVTGEDEEMLQLLASEGVVSEVMRLYWSRLYAFERVFLSGQEDDGVDYASLDPGTVVEIENGDILEVEQGAEDEAHQAGSSRAASRPLSPHSTATASKAYTGDYSTTVDDGEDWDSEEEPKPQTLLETRSRRFKKPQLLLHPETLMEMFTARPEHGRPLTWRHTVDVTGAEKFAPQDYTKTPIPRVSGRLMGRHREGLLMRRLEKMLADGPDARSRGAALESLVTRTWSKSFFLAIYPTLLDEVLRYTQTLLSNLQLESASSHLFNSENGDRDSSLNFLVRISVIFRNLAHASSNVNLLASHPGVIALLSNFASLKPFERPIAAFKASSSHRSLSEIRDLTPSWCKVDIPAETVLMEDSNSDASPTPSKSGDNGTSTLSHTTESAASVILKLKSNEISGQLADIQLNAMESLSKLIHLMRLSPTTSTAMRDLSPIGEELKKCMPVWVEIATSGRQKASLVFLAVESLARISMNSHSRPLWKTISVDSKAQLFSMLTRYAIMNDELADWALFVCYHLSLNAMDLSLAHALCKTSEILDHLMLLVASYSLPSQGSAETQKVAAYRRHLFAVRSATILHRLVEFVSFRSYLLQHEETFAEVFLRAHAEVADPLHLVFLEMQSPDPSVELV